VSFERKIEIAHSANSVARGLPHRFAQELAEAFGRNRRVIDHYSPGCICVIFKKGAYDPESNSASDRLCGYSGQHCRLRQRAIYRQPTDSKGAARDADHAIG